MQHFLFLVTVACVFTHTTGRTLLNDKIVGGNVASVGQFPYQISLRQNKIHFCGGSIIDKNTLLTAAHCLEVYPIANTTILAGTNTLNVGGKVFEVSRYILHHKWDPVNTTNDIAVIKVSKPIKFTPYIQPITIDETFIPANVKCVFSGWGDTAFPGATPNDLQYFIGNVVPLNECKEILVIAPYPVLESNICTFAKTGVGACVGDSGGPLASRKKQIGIASWSGLCAIGVPDVFTRVSYYSRWIKKQQAQAP